MRCRQRTRAVKSNGDHYQQDGFEEVGQFSKKNIFAALFLTFIFVCAVLSMWFSPPWHDVEVKEEVVIPWSPHPPVKHDPLYR